MFVLYIELFMLRGSCGAAEHLLLVEVLCLRQIEPTTVAHGI